MRCLVPGSRKHKRDSARWLGHRRGRNRGKSQKGTKSRTRWESAQPLAGRRLHLLFTKALRERYSCEASAGKGWSSPHTPAGSTLQYRRRSEAVDRGPRRRARRLSEGDGREQYDDSSVGSVGTRC